VWLYAGYIASGVLATGKTVPVVKWRMWKTMKTSSSTPPHRIVRDATVLTCSSRVV